jgi:putative transposase
VFISQNDKIKLFKDPSLLKEKFLLRERRKVKHDATFSMNKILYEAPQSFANTEIQVRYEPEWLMSVNIPILLYKDDKLIGEARQVNFHENAHMKRKSSYRPLKEADIQGKNNEIEIMETETISEQPISFNSIMGGMHNV